MRGALLKKKYGIPAALLLVLILSGTALAVALYCFATIYSVTEVKEPLRVASEQEFSADMYPGDNNTWCFKIVNSASVGYSVRADLTFDAPDGVSITSFTARDNNLTSGLTENNYVEFSISENETLPCCMQIIAKDNAKTGPVTASLSLSRQ